MKPNKKLANPDWDATVEDRAGFTQNNRIVAHN